VPPYIRLRAADGRAVCGSPLARGYDYRQNSISNWMRGVQAAPRDLPTLLKELYDLTTHEWLELAVAFAYGQRFRREDLEAIADAGKQQRRKLKEEAKGDSTQERSLLAALAAGEEPWKRIISRTNSAENG
jgi:hypothetical protein